MHRFDFDNEFFKDFDHNFGVQPKKLFKFGLGLWIAALFAVVAFWGTVGYVLLHFLGKFW